MNFAEKVMTTGAECVAAGLVVVNGDGGDGAVVPDRLVGWDTTVDEMGSR